MSATAGDRARHDAASRTRRAARVAARVAVTATQVTSKRSTTAWWSLLDRLVNEHIAQAPSVAQLRLWINVAVRCLTVSIGDSSRATAVLMTEGVKAQISALATARVCLESTGRLNYLLDQPDHMVEHALLMLWQDVHDEKPMNRWATERDIPIGHPLARDQVEQLTVALGWEADMKGGRFLGLRNPKTGERSSLPSATEQITRLSVPDAEQAWRISSGASHGRPWLLSHEIQDPDHPVPAAATLVAATTTIGAIEVTARLVGTVFKVPRLCVEADRIAGTEVGAPPKGWCAGRSD